MTLEDGQNLLTLFTLAIGIGSVAFYYFKRKELEAEKTNEIRERARWLNPPWSDVVGYRYVARNISAHKRSLFHELIEGHPRYRLHSVMPIGGGYVVIWEYDDKQAESAAPVDVVETT